jgi:alpha-beta hydrolase superfamily lysophospholipase
VEEGQLRSADGTRIFWRREAAQGKTRGRVLVVHGFAEHSGRYAHVLRGLAAKGFDAWGLDLRGHGRSDGGRGCITRWSDYLDDVSGLLGVAAPDRDVVPAFLLGHSMGGLVSMRFCQERPSGVKGLLLSSPFFRVKMPVPAVKRAAGRVLSSVLPNLAMPTGLDANQISRDPAVVKAYVDDPLVFTTATTRWFTETTFAQAQAFLQAPAFRMPVLLIHGAADGLVDPEASRELFEQLGSPDKTLKLWPELRHEILNEPEKEVVLATFVEWLLRLAPSPGGDGARSG